MDKMYPWDEYFMALGCIKHQYGKVYTMYMILT